MDKVIIESHPKHPYHLVAQSIWPLVISLGVFILTLGAALFMHDHGPWTLFAGITLVLYALVGWWRDVIDEAEVQNKHNSVVQRGLRYGMILFIITEILLFGGFFWGFFDASLFPSKAIGGVWPPATIHPIDPFKIPYLNTLLLLLSATSLTWSHASLLDNKREEARYGLMMTIALGLLFSLVQVYEFLEAPFKFQDGIYASNFYMLTGFHGAHVLIGTGFLSVCLYRLRQGHFTPTHHLGFEAAAWYWHFVDVVWLFLFVFLYWCGA
jgi:cytochrome c oxidase subunit 3